jgi:hypothetical protein
MTPVLDRLVDVVEVLAWPRVQVGELAIEGEAAWRSALAAAATPEERWPFLRALEPALLRATPAARERLAAWAAWGGPVDSALAEAETTQALLTYGDWAMQALAVRVVNALPGPVRAAAITEAAIALVGRSCGAFVQNARLVDHRGKAPCKMIVLAWQGEEAPTARLLRHEIAHAWLEPQPHDQAGPVTLYGEQRLHELAAEECWATQPADVIAKCDLLATALATCWERSF